MKLEEMIAKKFFETVARIFRKDESELTRETRFIEDLKAKSVNIVELIAVLQNEFEIEIPMAKVRRKKTIGEAIDFVISLRTR